MQENEVLNSPEYQLQVLNYMLHSPEFTNIAKEALKPEMFSDRCLAWYFDTLISAPIKLTRVTLKEELIKAANKKRIKKDEVPYFLDVFKKLKDPPLMEEREYIQSNISRFMKMQAVKKAIFQSFELAKEEKWDEISEIITKAANSGLDILSLGHDYFKDYESRLTNRLNRGEDHIVPTGIPELDNALTGGIRKKQVSMILGASGRGKSLALEWFARTAILLGLNVVYYTLELTEEDLAMRFDSMYSRIIPKELNTHHNIVLEKLSKFYPKYGSSLIIKAYLPGVATMSMIESHFRQLLSHGVRPDVVIIDYLDLLKPPAMYNDITKETDLLIQAMGAFAKQFDQVVWTAGQLNRSGIVSETPNESGVAGAISRIFAADVAIFMAQTPEESQLDELRLIISKSRNGKKGISISIETDFQFMSFFRQRIAEEQKKEENEESQS
jgi:replicative DNA helicase